MSIKRDQRVFDTIKNALNFGGRTYSRSGNLYLPLSIWSVSPSAGSAAGGVAMTIYGEGFQPDATVKVGGTSATSVVVGYNSITCVTPHCGGLSGLGAVDVVVTQASGVSAAGSYTQRDEGSLTLDGTNEDATILGISAPANGPFSVLLLVRRANDTGTKIILALQPGNTFGNHIEMYFTTGGVFNCAIQAGGVTKYAGATGAGGAPSATWCVVGVARTAAGIWTARAWPLGGAVHSAADSAAYDGIPAFTRLTIGREYGSGGYFFDGQVAVCVVASEDLYANGQWGAWVSSNGRDVPGCPANPATITHAYAPGLGDTIAAGLVDRGTVGTWGPLVCAASEAGDIAYGAGEFPGI